MAVIKRIAARRRVGERTFWTNVGVVVANEQGSLQLIVNLMPADLASTQLYLVDPPGRSSKGPAPWQPGAPPAGSLDVCDDVPF